ncbi:kinesin-like protein KIN-14B [Lolium rigidum]|uniref:kinesin-like protein KIN-14B n=1 Tax=Lolium rigidum TaxID=89674 RepID=UPI001F5C7DD1|nr:kinesin-like protein KIN-14B [Lolium rigidum]XP_047059389.1 kinesin-like protein KIN-14B [Lolium rigidum]XP_047059390.1 kinesin-like protein KIN-14B [Lolium rigidum]XP_047059391.1 kinesin-like protein KIN-14B [Lolium rigidum]
MDGQSEKTMRTLPDTLSSLKEFNKYLTPSWVESVSHIIKELTPTKPQKVMEDKAQEISECDDTEPDTKIAKIQDEMVSLSAQLKEITLQKRESLNNYLDLKGSIRVFCRIRPFNHEQSYSSRTMFTLDESNIFLRVSETKRKQYKFDKVFDPSSTQGDVFSEVEPLIKSAIDGYNVCIFAYGQTGSGKTYTMEGKPTDLGVIPRGIQVLLDRASESNNRFLFTFSMLEIYMGNLRDLLVPGSKTNGFKNVPSLAIKTDPDGGIEIENLVAVTVNNFQEVKRLYGVGTRLRSTASTMANSTSSRSHCLIRISMTSFDAPERKKARNKLWMIDLGGSERLVKTKATGKRLKEGKAINLSLSALGDVIDALQTKKTHVPYRNSKLTQVLRDSLGCESKTLMLVHIRPNENDLCETVCTLGFATRVRSIRLESEESPDVKARKEQFLMELGQKVNDLEQECDNIKRKVKKLEDTMEQLKGPQLAVSTNFVISPPSTEELKINMSKNVRSLKNHREVSSGLPRFMRPTAASQHRIGLNNNVPSINRLKPPVPPKRRPSSVYAESIRLPVNADTWQSECSSECSISMTSDINWTPSIQDGTEYSQDASEYEIKQVIFSEHEKPSQGQVISFKEWQLAESENMQNKTEERGIIDIDNWIHQQILESTVTCQSKMGLNVPKVTGDETSNIRSPIKIEGAKGCNKALDEENDLALHPPPLSAKDIKQANADNHFSGAELRSPPSRERCSNNETNKHTNESFAYHGRSRRSLQEKLDDCMLRQPDKEADLSACAEIRSQEEEEHIGKLTKFFQALQIAWVGVGLGLGTASLGLEDDFFHSLML